MKLYAEYDDPEALARAIPAVRAWAPANLDALTPYPVPVIDRALAGPPSRVSLFAFAAGIGAAGGAYGLQWLLDAYLYPLNVGGRPAHFPLAFVPITFEMTVLFASLTAFLGVLVGARLLRLWDPSREIPGIESATRIRFWLVVDVPQGADVGALRRILDGEHVHSIVEAP
jgi:hypothetical protein